MTKNENLKKILSKPKTDHLFTWAEIIEFIEQDLNYLADQYEKYHTQDLVPIPRPGLYLFIVDFGHLCNKLGEIKEDLNKPTINTDF